MDVGAAGGKLLAGPAGTVLLDSAANLLQRDRFRGPALRAADRLAGPALRLAGGKIGERNRLDRERVLLARAILSTLDRLLAAGALSPHLTRVITRLWVRALMVPVRVTPQGREFRARYGCDPPWFVAVSPGHACNLRCPGCYASSEAGRAKLDWRVFDRVITEAKRLWDIRLVVLSGGEPMAYSSGGRDLLDIVERHPDCLFLMFTNGTLITREAAARMERLGNLTPALSVEGMREGTDRRRGSGVFDRVMESMSLLREAGVPVGISATVTRANCRELMSERFLDFFFEENGAFYGFFFHYMPTGRDADPDMMPTPEQRLEFWRRSWDAISRKKVFLFDFWNHGTLVNGCVAAGRERGYVYVDWEGKVMPCVFAPYSVGNVNELFERGSDLNELWEAPFFEAFRGWQRGYGYGNGGPSRKGNLLLPCPVRDHYRDFRTLLETHAPEPEDEAARFAAADEEYYLGLVTYGEELARLSQGIWEAEYL
jgi:MoaA/NifB/PqqE/SkfB family radical SAM enzyme